MFIYFLDIPTDLYILYAQTLHRDTFVNDMAAKIRRVFGIPARLNLRKALTHAIADLAKYNPGIRNAVHMIWANGLCTTIRFQRRHVYGHQPTAQTGKNAGKSKSGSKGRGKGKGKRGKSSRSRSNSRSRQ